MTSALHVYQTWIGHTNNNGYNPISVYVKRGTGNQAETIAEFRSKTLKPLLAKATATIIESETNEGMI